MLYAMALHLYQPAGIHHDASIAYFNSKPIYWLCVLFMLLGGVNFSLHYLGLFKGNLKVYWKNLECRHFIYFMIIVTLISISILYYYKVDMETHWIVLDALFQVISFATTTGFVSDNNYFQWPSIMPIMLLLLELLALAADLQLVELNLYEQC